MSSESGERILEGSCGCGAALPGRRRSWYAANCHCSRCRAATGSAFKAFAGIERERFQVTQESTAFSSSARTERHALRCVRLAPLRAGGRVVHVAMGSLVDAPSIRPTEHIYVGSKAPWFEITDDLPQFDELDG